MKHKTDHLIMEMMIISLKIVATKTWPGWTPISSVSRGCKEQQREITPPRTHHVCPANTWVKMFKSTEFSINESVIVSPAGRLWTYIHHIHLHSVTWNIKSFFMRYWWHFIPRWELDTLSEATVADIKKREKNKKNLVTPRKRQQKFFTHERRIIPLP